NPRSRNRSRSAGRAHGVKGGTLESPARFTPRRITTRPWASTKFRPQTRSCGARIALGEEAEANEMAMGVVTGRSRRDRLVAPRLARGHGAGQGTGSVQTGRDDENGPRHAASKEFTELST